MKRSALPTLGDLLGIFLLLMVVLVGGTRLFGDSDPAWHVAAGNWIIHHHQVPRTDPFFATERQREWIAYEWLSDAAFALVHRWAGWSGIVALSALLIAATHFLLYRFLVGWGHNPLVSFFAVMAAAAAASSHWLARPHLFTVLLLVIWTALLEGVVQGRCSRLWLTLLPPMAILWTNLHGGFLLGPATLGCYWVGNLIRARPWISRGAPVATPVARARSLVAVLTAACVGAGAAILFNPWGWRLPAHILAFFTYRRSHLATIEEFAPPSLRDRAGWALFVFLALAAAGLAGAAWAYRARKSGHPDKSAATGGGPSLPHPGLVLAFGMGTFMALRSVRHGEIVSVFGAMIMAEGVSALLRLKIEPSLRASMEAWRGYEARSGGAAFGFIAVVVLALARIAAWPPSGFDPARFPVRMVAALKEENLVPAGPVFVPDWWGGYLILEWPRARVFVDGRSDMFGDDFLRRYAAIYRAERDWSRQLDEAGINWLVLPRDAPLAAALSPDSRWEAWGADSTATVIRRKSAPFR